MRNQQLFEAPFVSEVGVNYCSKCTRAGAGKCTCNRFQQSGHGSKKSSREFEFLFEAPFSSHPSYYSSIGIERKYESQRLFEAPYTGQEYYSHPEADAMFGWAKKKWEQWRKGKAESKDMTRERMANFLQDKWNRNPILRRLGNAQRLRRQALHRELINILSEFERTTGITMQVVPEGTVQRLRNQPGNFASLRSRSGFLQIEQQVFQNTAQLLKEVRHELAYHYAGGPGKVPRLMNTPFNALQLLEFMIQGNGKLPPPVAPLSSHNEAENWIGTGTLTNF